VATLAKSGKQNFRHTARFLRDDNFLFQKGVICYDRSKFEETTLPPKEKFYNHLIDEDISDEDYERARNIWTRYDMRNLS